MLKNKFKAVAVIALMVITSVFAEDVYKVKEPKRGHVLVIGKVTYKKPINLEARENNFREYKGSLYSFGKIKDFSLSSNINNTDGAITDSIDGYFYQEIKVPKDGKLHLNHITVSMFRKSNSWFQFNLPADATINVPDDAVYVYIGTFEYDLDYALRTVGFRHLDEYEEAEKNLSRDLGKKIELYRAAISFDTEEKDKK